MVVHAESGLEKTVWSTNDFDQMGWHDAQVHGLSFDSEQYRMFVLFDLDYIVQWVKPPSPDGYFSFWVAPATLVFEDVWGFRIEGEADNVAEIEILDLDRLPLPVTTPGVLRDEWHLGCDTLDIHLKASGFKQYFRRPPVLSSSQRLDLPERGGISFDRAGFDRVSR